MSDPPRLTQFVRAGDVPLELIAPAMGHASTQMLERVYGRLTPDVLAARISAVTGTVAAQRRAGSKPENGEQ